jgi:hypothetical protein
VLLRPLKSALPQAPAFSDNADEWTLWCCRTKEAMPSRLRAALPDCKIYSYAQRPQ